jgi:hypothetical protein
LHAWLLAEIVAATQAYCGSFHILKFVALAHRAPQIVGAIIPMAPLAQRRAHGRAAEKERRRERRAVTNPLAFLKTDPLVEFTIDAAADAFIQSIGEAQEVLGEFERYGFDPARFPLLFGDIERPDRPVPGVDAKGHALVVLMHKTEREVFIFHARRTRALAWHTMDARLRFVRAVKNRPREAAKLPSARKAREAFWKALRDARDRDCAAEAARG